MATRHSLTFKELMAELQRHQRKLPALQRKAAKLQKQLDAVLAEIEVLSGGASKKRGGRPVAAKTGEAKSGTRLRNKQNLAEAIVAVLDKTHPKTPTEIINAVKSGGYKSTSRNFSTIVYQALARDKKRIAKAGRGLYTLK